MIAFHAIITTYGFWLPNDPRGSWSSYVGNPELYRYGGQATKVNTTQSVAHRAHDSRFRVAAKSHLKYPPVRFSDQQARIVAAGFQAVADDSGYSILALAVLSTHIHAVISQSHRSPGQLIGHLKRAATDHLIDHGAHPCQGEDRITHSCWARQAWKVFIDTEDHLDSAIGYVQWNPVKDGLPCQEWSFIEQHRRRYFATNGPASGPANA